MAVLDKEGYGSSQPIDLESELTGENTNKILLDLLLSAGGIAGGSRVASKLLKNLPWLKRMKGSHHSPRSWAQQHRAMDPDLYDYAMKDSSLKERVYDTIKRGTVIGKGPGSLLDYLFKK